MNAKKLPVTHPDKGRKKMLSYVKSKISEELFLPAILKLRLKYKIPSKGYSENVMRVWDLSFTNITNLPPQWAHHGDIPKLKRLMNDIRTVKSKQFLENDFWDILLLEY